MSEEWCKDCIRPNCTQTVEECMNTPEITADQIYEAMIKYAQNSTSTERDEK